MHDLSALEMNEQFDEMEWEGDANEAQEAELDEGAELEAAAELLSVGSESELDQFLGGLIGRIAPALINGVRGGLGQALKGFARTALPVVGTALGGPIGGAIASDGLDASLKAFGLELEGLSQEDQELEVARRFVRVASAAVRRAHQLPVARDHRAHAYSALRWATHRYAPAFAGRLFGGNRGPAWHAHRHHTGHAGYWGSPPYPDQGAYPYDPDSFPEEPGAPADSMCPTCGVPSEPVPPHDAAAAVPVPPVTPSPDLSSNASSSGELDRELYGTGFDAGLDGGARSGRWVRRGNKIILFGA